MKVATKTTNPHAWFFAYLKTVDGWGQGYDEVIKEGIIFDYSDGKTESLKELFEKYPTKYRKMRAELSPKNKQDIKNKLDQARKRLIAAIFENVEQNGYQASMEYVKAVACQGAKEKRFNDIPLQTLKNLYNRFKNKNLNKQLDELITDCNLWE